MRSLLFDPQASVRDAAYTALANIIAKTPQSVARETGGTVLVLSPSVGGEKDITDYIRLFDHDVKLLVAALKAARH